MMFITGTLSLIKSLLRSLFRDRTFALTNIVGLAVAFMCCTGLAFYLKDELGYDKYHLNHERIYRLIAPLPFKGNETPRATAPQALGPLFAQDFAEVENFVRFRELTPGYPVSYENTTFFWDTLMYADPGVFDMFTHQILAGSPENALTEPDTIAISQSFAENYFGSSMQDFQSVIGRVLSTPDSEFRITLVFADLPDNTHLKYDALVSYNNVPVDTSRDALFAVKENAVDFTYLLLPENYDTAGFSTMSEAFNQKHIAPFDDEAHVDYYLEPLADIHFNSSTIQDKPRGNLVFLSILIAVGAMVLLLGCANYISLLTARSITRLKEMYMRKVLGASRTQIFSRLMGESIFLSLIAGLLSLAILALLLPLAPLAVQLEVESLQQQAFTFNTVSAVLLMAAGFGFIAGIYPSWYLTRQSIQNTTNKKFNEAKGSSIKGRMLLTVIQITISITVTSCALLMYSQLKLVQSKSFAFDVDNTLVVYLRYDTMRDRLALLTNELATSANVVAFTASRDVPGGIERISRGSITGGREFPVHMRSVGPDYVSVMGIELIAGTDLDFNVAMTADTRQILVNEAFLAEAGWSAEEAIGKYYGNGQIVGVTKNFTWNPRSPVVPTQLVRELYNGYRYLFIKIPDQNQQQSLDFLASTWKKIIPEYQLEYEFFDDYVNGLLISDAKQSVLTGIAAAICVVLSYIGVTGIVAYLMQRRAKELSLRRVFGATFWQLTALILRNLYAVAGVSAVLALVIYYLSVAQWLQSYSQQTGINLLIYVTATIISMTMILMVVLLQSRTASTVSPMERLRED
jgi:putative ABC transport system permease protein